MNEERKRILQLVQNKTLSAAEGAALLGALGAESTTETSNVSVPMSPQHADWRWLVIRVTDTASGRSKVHVRMPYGLLQFGLRLGGIADFDESGLRDVLNQSENGSLLEVIDEEDSEHVQIFLE